MINTIRWRTLAAGAGLVMTLGLGACSILPEPAVLTQYQLPAQTLPATRQASPTRDFVIRIVTPYTDQAYGSNRIIVLPEGNQVRSYEGARWTDSGPVLLRNRVASGLRDLNQFRSVVLDVDNTRADLELDGNLEHFQVIYDQGQPKVQITFDARLHDARRTMNLVESRRFRIEQPVQGKDVAQVVEAFGLAADRLTLELAQWVMSQNLR